MGTELSRVERRPSFLSPPHPRLPSRVRPAGAALGPAVRSVLSGRQVAPARSIRSPAAELRTPQTIPSAAAADAAKLNNPPVSLRSRPPTSNPRRPGSASARALGIPQPAFDPPQRPPPPPRQPSPQPRLGRGLLGLFRFPPPPSGEGKGRASEGARGGLPSAGGRASGRPAGLGSAGKAAAAAAREARK